jgi:hypothetical protein
MTTGLKKSKYSSYRLRRVDFVAPLSLEACAKRLSSLQDKRVFFNVQPNTQAEIIRVDDDTYALAFQRSLPKSTVSIKAWGHLKRWDAQTTRVTLHLKPFIFRNFVGPFLPSAGLIALGVAAQSPLMVFIWGTISILIIGGRLLDAWNLWHELIQILDANIPIDRSTYQSS